MLLRLCLLVVTILSMVTMTVCLFSTRAASKLQQMVGFQTFTKKRNNLLLVVSVFFHVICVIHLLQLCAFINLNCRLSCNLLYSQQISSVQITNKDFSRWFDLAAVVGIVFTLQKQLAF